MSQPHLTPEQTAQLLNVSPKTLANWRLTTGRGPVFLKYGSGSRAPVRYAVEDLDQFIRDSKRSSTSATAPPEIES